MHRHSQGKNVKARWGESGRWSGLNIDLFRELIESAVRNEALVVTVASFVFSQRDTYVKHGNNR
jgi:hypothetical protein